MYGFESWTLKRMKKDVLTPLRRKDWGRYCQVSWTAKKTNEWVLNKAGVRKELLNTVKAKKLAYYGHTEKEIMRGTMPGARRWELPCTAWMDDIKTWTVLIMEQSIRMTEVYRDKWRKYVHGVANYRIDDSWRTEQTNCCGLLPDLLKRYGFPCIHAYITHKFI